MAASVISDLYPTETHFHTTAGKTLFFEYQLSQGGVLSPMVYAYLTGARNGAARVAIPVSVAVYVVIQNTWIKPITFTGYSLEVSENANGPWTTLCNVTISKGGGLYWGMPDENGTIDFTNSIEFETNNALDQRLTETVVSPGATVFGWTFWEHPGQVKPPNFGRITLSAADGVHEKQYLALRASEIPTGGFSLLQTSLEYKPGRSNIMPIQRIPACARALQVAPRP